MNDHAQPELDDEDALEEAPEQLAEEAFEGEASEGRATPGVGLTVDRGPRKPDRVRTDIAAFREAFARLPARGRIDAIMDCDDVMRVVRSLPAQDLFLTLKEIGPEEALEIVELLHPRQVQTFLDLDGWRKDRVDGEGIGGWLEILYAASPDRAVRQILGLDIELLSLLFKMYTRAFEIEEGVDLPVELDEALTSVTPDYRYCVVYGPAPGREKLLLALRTTVERLFGIDLPFVLHLIQAVRWDLPSSLEEEAFRFRAARLADLGFGDVSEPAAMFAWLDPDSAIGGLPLSTPEFLEEGEEIDPGDPPLDLSRAVHVPWSLLDDGQHILGGSTRALPESIALRVAHELGQVINRLHLVSGGDLGDPGALSDTARRAADTVGLALAYRAKGDAKEAEHILAQTAVLYLFRAGHSLATRLATTLREHLSRSGGGLDGHGMLRLDPPLREVVAGLLLVRPVFFRGLTEPARTDYRHFASLSELAETAHALNEAAMRAAMLASAPLSVDDAKMAAFGVETSAAQPAHSALLGAAFARLVLDLPPTAAPLSDAELVQFSTCLVRDAKSPEDNGFNAADRDRVSAFVESLTTTVLGKLPGATDVATRAARWGDQVRLAIEEEFGALTETPDGRFVRTVWTQRSLDAAAAAPPAAAPSADDDNHDEDVE